MERTFRKGQKMISGIVDRVMYPPRSPGCVVVTGSTEGVQIEQPLCRGVVLGREAGLARLSQEEALVCRWSSIVSARTMFARALPSPASLQCNDLPEDVLARHGVDTYGDLIMAARMRFALPMMARSSGSIACGQAHRVLADEQIYVDTLVGNGLLSATALRPWYPLMIENFLYPHYYAQDALASSDLYGVFGSHQFRQHMNRWGLHSVGEVLQLIIFVGLGSFGQSHVRHPFGLIRIGSDRLNRIAKAALQARTEGDLHLPSYVIESLWPRGQSFSMFRKRSPPFSAQDGRISSGF